MLKLGLVVVAVIGGVYGFRNRVDAADAEGVLSGLAFFALLALTAKAFETAFELEEPGQKERVKRYLTWWVLYAAVGALGIALGGRTALGSPPGSSGEPQLLSACRSTPPGDLPPDLRAPTFDLWCFAPTASETLAWWEYVLPLIVVAGFVIPLLWIAKPRPQGEPDTMPC